MPRTHRPVLPGVPHHVTLRGNNRRRLFSYPRDYSHFVFLMHRHLPVSDVSIHGFCLMANHVHLLLTPSEEGALAAFIKPIAQRYAQVRNLRYETTGKLFEQRYHSVPIRSEKHLAVATAYIDLNPVRASLVLDPALYRWSTFRVHAGYRGHGHFDDLWTPTEWYKRLGPDRYARAEAYHDWIDQCREFYEQLAKAKDPANPSGPPPTRPNRSRAAS